MAGLTHVPPAPYHDEGLIDMMEAMRRANVATYAIDPRGKVDSKDLARECFPPPAIPDPCSNEMADWYSAVRLAQHGLEITSAASGGFAVTNTDDFTSGIKRIVDDLDHYYLLGFYPADTKGKGYRPLDVRIAGHPDWTLRFRHGYMPGGPPAPPKNADPLVALSAGILPKTDLPLRLTAIALPGAGPATRMVVALEVSAPRSALQEADGKVRDTLKYDVLVVDQKKARVKLAVERLIWTEHEDHEAERLVDDLDDLLEAEALAEAFADAPIEAVIAKIGADLGLPPAEIHQLEGQTHGPAVVAPNST